MLVVVGLGNPGSEYAGTRHNAGFAVVQALSEELDLPLRTSGDVREASGRRLGGTIVLAQPLTYMNNSGEAVLPLLGRHEAGPAGLIVCADDLHLPLGAVRLRSKGGHGGHNGLRSVIAALGTEEFPRLRCGIRGETAPATGGETASYVLSPFNPGEQAAVRTMVETAASAVLAIAREGIDRAMNVVNTRGDGPPTAGTGAPGNTGTT